MNYVILHIARPLFIMRFIFKILAFFGSQMTLKMSTCVQRNDHFIIFSELLLRWALTSINKGCVESS